MKPLFALARFMGHAQSANFLAPLALRLYLVPVFWVAGTGKLMHMEATIAWFGDPEWGLGLPFPALMAWLAASSETLGAVLLALGLGVRLVVVPLMMTMAVAALKVHWANGWAAIAEPAAPAAQRLAGLLDWLAQEHPGRHAFVTELGSPVILNNGVEFAATYFVMLLVLFFSGGGRFVSVDWWLGRCAWPAESLRNRA